MPDYMLRAQLLLQAARAEQFRLVRHAGVAAVIGIARILAATAAERIAALAELLLAVLPFAAHLHVAGAVLVALAFPLALTLAELALHLLRHLAAALLEAAHGLLLVRPGVGAVA